jgi:hypothetical protein
MAISDVVMPTQLKTEFQVLVFSGIEQWFAVLVGNWNSCVVLTYLMSQKCCQLVMMGQVCRMCSSIWSRWAHIHGGQVYTQVLVYLQCPVQSWHWNLSFSLQSVDAVYLWMESVMSLHHVHWILCFASRKECFDFAEDHTGVGLLHSHW